MSFISILIICVVVSFLGGILIIAFGGGGKEVSKPYIDHFSDALSENKDHTPVIIPSKKRRKLNILRRVYECKGAFVADRKSYILSNVSVGDSIRFEEEPSNYYDTLAIKILHGRKKIGYVGREDHAYIDHLLYQDYEAVIHKISFNGTYIDVYYKILSCDNPTF